MNSIFAIAPYKFQDMWVFDDPGVGLRQEPFVSGADQIIDVLTENIPGAAQGFKLVFSPEPSWLHCPVRLEPSRVWGQLVFMA